MDLGRLVEHKHTQAMISQVTDMAAAMTDPMKMYKEGFCCVLKHYANKLGMMTEMKMLEEYSNRFSNALEAIVGSPDLHGGINKMLMSMVAEMDMKEGRLEKMVLSDINFQHNMRERIMGIDVTEVVETLERVYEDILTSLKEGDWSKMKMMMDRVDMMLQDDNTWIMIESSYQMMMNMTSHNMGMHIMDFEEMMISMGMIRDECIDAEDPIMCCISICLNQGMTMLESLGGDMDGTLNTMTSAMDGMFERMEEEYIQGNMIVAPMTEMYGMTCMMEEAGMGIGMMEDAKQMITQMMQEMMGDGAPVGVINVAMDGKMRIMELVMGTCPPCFHQEATMYE